MFFKIIQDCLSTCDLHLVKIFFFCIKCDDDRHTSTWSIFHKVYRYSPIRSYEVIILDLSHYICKMRHRIDCRILPCKIKSHTIVFRLHTWTEHSSCTQIMTGWWTISIVRRIIPHHNICCSRICLSHCCEWCIDFGAYRELGHVLLR